MDDAAKVKLLGGQDGKALRQVEAHLMAKEAQSSGARAIGTFLTLIEELLQQV